MNPRRPQYSAIFAGHDEGEALAQNAAVLWELYKGDLERRRLWNAARAQVLDRLVRFRVEFDYLHPIVVAEGPTLTGPQGGQFANMRWSMVQKLSDRCERLEAALALTPQSIGHKDGKGSAANYPPAAADEFLNAADNAADATREKYLARARDH